VRSRRIQFVVLAGCAAAILAACASAKPHVFGEFNDLSPRVAPVQGERIPQHLTVQLGRPANVAVFYVVPGRGSTLLFPQDSTATQYVEAGSHLVQTAQAGMTMSDTSRLMRIPAGGGARPQGGRTQNRGGFGRDSLPMPMFNQRGYLLVFASQQPLAYKTLTSRVAGISIPIDDDDALNTVIKLIRETTQINGPWAAFASDYPP
jgi:hypothetical protein